MLMAFGAVAAALRQAEDDHRALDAESAAARHRIADVTASARTVEAVDVVGPAADDLCPT